MKNKPTGQEFEIFPYLMVRYASGHHTEFEALRYPGMNDLNGNLKTLETQVLQLKDALCDYLYQAVSTVSSVAQKQFLVNIKRDIFNNREPDPAVWTSFIKTLPPERQKESEHYTALKNQLKDYYAKFQNNYDAHLPEQRKFLQGLAKNELFQKGIRLSSKVLSDQLSTFIKAPVNTFKTKELRQEYSLLRYLTRMFFKTSPFSTFTHLGTGNLTAEPEMELPEFNDVKSQVRLNNEIFSYLTTLLALNPEINDQVYVRFNPTIETNGNSVTFMVNFHNLESFQKTGNTPIIQALLQIRDGHAFPLRLNQITVKLAEIAGHKAPEIKSYLLKLVEIGFLEFDFQTSGVSPEWVDKLLDYLRTIQDPGLLLIKTIEVLSQQQNNCQQYGEAGIEQRGNILQSMFGQMSLLYAQHLGSLGLGNLDKETYVLEYQASFDAEKFKKHPFLLPRLDTETLIYEDCFTETEAGVSHEAMKEIVTCVNEICDFLEPLDGSRIEKNRMNAFFVKEYGKNTTVPVLNFYRDYYSQVKNPAAEGNHSDQHQEAYTLFYNQWVARLKDLLKDVKPCDEAVLLNRNIIQGMNTGVKEAAGPVSRGMFAQCFLQEGHLRAVINTVFLGMGRASGRFLHLFDPSVTEKLKEFNSQISTDCLLMELADGSYFNANTHPPLLPYELRIPDGHNSLPASAQIPVEDIQVYYNHSEEQTCLRHRTTGQRILPYDLCLQSLTQRSKLYQLLAHFSPDQSVSFLPIQRAIKQVIFDSGPKTKREVYYFPRIIYEEKIILKRKSWSVLNSFVPKKGEQQSDAHYFITINQWRKKNGFPRQVFLYLKPRSAENSGSASDDYKPQYICFDTPLLVLLWCRLLKKAGEYIYFEEMMPDTKTLAENPVNEFLVQWYRKES